MYSVDDRDKVVPIDSLPQSDCSAPLPIAVCGEHMTLIAFVVQRPVARWDGTELQIIDYPGPDEPIAILRFLRAQAVMFGPPNDEAFAGHPLASRGLQPYGAFEVLDSSWIRTHERMNRVHPRHKDGIGGRRHFILAFHDSVFECVAEGVEVVQCFDGNINQAIERMAAMIAAHPK